MKMLVTKKGGVMLKKVNTWLPVFNGFYNTIFDGADSFIDYETSLCEDEFKEYYEELYKGGVSYEFFQENFYDFCDFKRAYKEASIYLCDALKDIDCSGIIDSIEFESLQSPRYYNFSNDSINCEITFNTELLQKYLDENLEEFELFIRGRYTSCSGFHSNYSNDVNDWLDVNEFGAHKVGSVLEFVIYNDQGDMYRAIEALYYESNISEAFHNCTEIDYEAFIKSANKKGA